MALSFSFGMKQFWNELTDMQATGLYWVSADSQTAGYQLAGQVLSAQETEVTTTIIYPQDNLITAKNDSRLPADDALISSLQAKNISSSYYELDSGKKAFLALSDDLNRVIKGPRELVILLFPASTWHSLNDKELNRWLKEMTALLQHKKCAALIICHGKVESRLNGILNINHRLIYGFSRLKTDIEPAQLVLSWWHNHVGIEANTSYSLQKQSVGWRVIPRAAASEQNIPLSDDQWAYLAHRSVLEGAPPLSENWLLFDDNAQLTDRGMHARSATLIFALNNSDHVETLARQIHLLRLQRGNGLKIVVREMSSSLRYIDQRLLQACGANLVVPHAARLSNFLTLLDDIQQLTFTRHVPDDIEQLLQGRLPTHHKGFLPLPTFCDVMQSLWSHAALATENRGVLIALRAVTGITPQQAMSLCHLRRDGDVITLTERHLYLFLSNCQVNDVEQVLNSLFSLPVNEVFASRTVWHQDNDIQSEVRRLAAKKTLPEQVLRPQTAEPTVAMPTQRTHAPLPEPIILTLSDVPLSRSIADATLHRDVQVNP